MSIGTSLDGFIAGANRGPQNPLGDQGMKLHEWLFHQQAFLESLHLPGTGETGPDNDRVVATRARIGANIMGKRMFEEGETNWPEEAPLILGEGLPLFDGVDRKRVRLEIALTIHSPLVTHVRYRVRPQR